MMGKKKLTKKAVEHLLEAEDALDTLIDLSWDKAQPLSGEAREKAMIKHNRLQALSGMAYELRRLVEL